MVASRCQWQRCCFDIYSDFLTPLTFLSFVLSISLPGLFRNEVIVCLRMLHPCLGINDSLVRERAEFSRSRSLLGSGSGRNFLILPANPSRAGLLEDRRSCVHLLWTSTKCVILHLFGLTIVNYSDMLC